MSDEVHDLRPRPTKTDQDNEKIMRPMEPAGTGAAVRIGRFAVLEAIGQGGMGLVYSAYDERLDRKVAIKVLGDRQFADREAQLRFQREAQALARLSHPNVVAVHEVGSHDGGMFLAMEFVRGQSVADWIRREPRWPEVVEVFTQVGRGLVAAHEAGLVHRDLKPHNFMRGDDGVVKVLDFGLARTTSEMPPTLEDGKAEGEDQSTVLTRTGALMGTPAYMSPEQFRGEALDARSDQFSFCVALYEALYGQRPFVGRSVAELQHAVEQAASAEPEADRGVPSWLLRVVRRGLRPRPSERWPSMAALLRQLDRTPVQRRHRWLLGGGGVIVLGLGGVALGVSSEAGGAPCSGAADRMVGVWDDARREAVRAATIGIGRSFATDVWERARRELDDYADRWVAMHTDACAATAIRREQSARMLDLRMACLHRAALELGATVDTLASADAPVVRRAHELLAGLPPLTRCADRDALLAEVEPAAAADAEAVEAARVQLARARSEERAGRYEPALAAVEAARAAIEGVAYGPIQTEVALLRGDVLDELGRYDDAEAAYVHALRLASDGKRPEPMGEAALDLMFVVGQRQQRVDEGLRYWPLVQGLSADDPENSARARSARGKLLESQGDSVAAEREHRAALEGLSELLGPGHPDVTLARNDLGTVLQAQGKYAEAEAEFRVALASSQQTLGPSHPDVAVARNNLGATLDLQGRYPEAEAEHRAALALREEALGHDHPYTASSRNNLAVVLQSQGKNEEAEKELRVVFEQMSAAVGAEHPRTAAVRINLGIVLHAQGKNEEAEAEYRQALALHTKALGPDHPYVTLSRSNLGTMLNLEGRHEEAEAEHREVLAVRLRTLGPEHPEIATSRNNLGNTLGYQGRHEEAEAEYRAALALWHESLGPEHPSVLDARHNLANTLLDRGQLQAGEAEQRATLELRLKVLGADHSGVAASRSDLAQALVMLGRYADALPFAEQAWDRRRNDDISADERAETAFLIARILWSIEGPTRDRARARGRAEQALRAYQDAGERYEARATDVERWLGTHRLPRR